MTDIQTRIAAVLARHDQCYGKANGKFYCAGCHKQVRNRAEHAASEVVRELSPDIDTLAEAIKNSDGDYAARVTYWSREAQDRHYRRMAIAAVAAMGNP